jgi:hypothetical protein
MLIDYQRLHGETKMDIDNLNIKCDLLGKIKKNNWDCYAWNVTFKFIGKPLFVTQYYTGLGLIKKPVLMNKPVPKTPCNKDIMYSLLLDASAIDESFNNWCDNFGYESDSIKAFNIYQECCNTAKELSKLFTRAELADMRGQLQDY